MRIPKNLEEFGMERKVEKLSPFKKLLLCVDNFISFLFNHKNPIICFIGAFFRVLPYMLLVFLVAFILEFFIGLFMIRSENKLVNDLSQEGEVVKIYSNYGNSYMVVEPTKSEEEIRAELEAEIRAEVEAEYELRKQIEEEVRKEYESETSYPIPIEIK